MRFLGLVLASILILFAIEVQESASARPYVDIMDFAFEPKSVIVIGNVIDGKKIVEGLDTIVKYDIKVETYLKNPIGKDTIHTFSQPTPTGGRGGNNYSYFDIGDKVILVLHPPNDETVAKKHPDTYYINDLINPHHIESQLHNIWPVKKQIEYLLFREPEHISEGYYKTRHSEILCNMDLKKNYKQTDVFASCVTSDTFKKLIQRGWNAIGPVFASDLKQNYAVDLSTDKQQYSIGDDVQMIMKNSGDISVIMKSGFGDLTLRNISTDELIKMWYSSDSDINRNSGGILRLLMPNDQRILERNLWDESKIESGTYEISITYTIMNKGTPVNISDHAQFNVK